MADFGASGGGFDPDQGGAPTRPKGEIVAADAHMAGGSNCGTLTNTTGGAGRTDTTRVEPAAGRSEAGGGGGNGRGDSDGGTKDERFIVRATMKFRLYPQGPEEWTELHEFRQQAVHAANVLLRTYYRLDGESLDAFIAEHGHPPRRGKDWPMAAKPQINSYQTVRRAAPQLASGAVAQALQRQVDQYWKRWRWDTLVFCKRQPPLFRETRAIPFRAAEVKVKAQGDRWAIDVPMWSGRNGGRRQFVVSARDAREKTTLRALSKGDWRVGNAALIWDERKRRYYIRVSYTKRVDTLPVTSRTAAIQRGIRQFLVAVTYDGATWIDEGHDLVEHRKRSAARRRQIQSSIKASRRKGRGRKRALKAIRKLQDKTMRWRDTRTQQLARSMVRWLAQQGVTILYVEDFRDIRRYCEEQLGERIAPYVHDWRYDDLKNRVVSCAEEEGMHVVEVPAEYISRTCPQCEAAVEPDLKAWKLRCGECGYNRDLDVAAAVNVRQRGERFGGEVLVGDESLKKMGGVDPNNGTSRKTGRKSPKKRGRKNGGRKT